MRVLALDTATEIGAIALVEGDTLLAQTQLRVEKTHSKNLWRAIRFLLAETGWGLEQIDLWAVSTGPGSFTGVRIGLATVKGLAWVTQKPVIGVSTLEVLALSVTPTPYLICPILDARRQEVYFAFYRYTSAGAVRMVREPGPFKAPGFGCRRSRNRPFSLDNGVRRYQEIFKDRFRASSPGSGGLESPPVRLYPGRDRARTVPPGGRPKRRGSQPAIPSSRRCGIESPGNRPAKGHAPESRS